MKQITIHKKCEKCKDGELIFNGMCLTSNPMQYVHSCDKCNSSHNLNKTYPHSYMEFEEHEKEELWETI